MNKLERLKLAEGSILSMSSKPSRKIATTTLIVLLSYSIIAGLWVLPLGNEPTHSGNNDIFFDDTSENDYGNLKGWFTENGGQLENPDVRFAYSGLEITIGFQESGYILRLDSADNISSFVYVTFEGSNRVMPEGVGELPHKSNYFIGNDSSSWQRNVLNYQRVVYENLYDYIDLVFYTSEEGVKYDFIVHPGGNPDHIQLVYEGQDALFTDDSGNLIVACPSGELLDGAPFCYQIENGERVEVVSNYQINVNEVSYDINDYDPTKILVIDPLIFSTFLGGSLHDLGRDIVVDSENNIYLIGTTASPDFPTTNFSYNPLFRGTLDVFISKLSPDGSYMLYSTYIGGSFDDYGRAIAIDSNNFMYITGYTSSADFPTTFGSYDPIFNGGTDVFVCKISPDGSNLTYSTFIGGSEVTAFFEPDEFGWANAPEEGYALELDDQNNVYVTGITDSPDFPTTIGAYDTSYNDRGDCFILKLNQDGSDLIFSTFIGGSHVEWFGGSFALDSDYNIYVTGATGSTDFPTTPGCYDDSYNGGDTDIILFKLTSDGSDLVYSTYIGGKNWDRGWRIALDSEANAYLTGWTFSDDFPTTPGCFDSSLAGGSDIIVLKMNQDGSGVVYSTLLGGSDNEFHSQIALDSNNDVYISGSAFSDNGSTDFPVTPGCYDDSHNGNWDGILCKLNSDGSELLYSTFFGGEERELNWAIYLESENRVYVTGYTESPDFPTTPGSYDNSHNGEYDVYALKINITSGINDPNNEDDNEDETYIPNPSQSAAGLVLIGAFGLIGLGFFREDFRYILFSLLALPLYSKIEKDELLDQPNRNTIYTFLHENPGINLTKIHREMDLGYGTIVHHLNILEKKNLITSKKEMGLKTFYPKKLKNHKVNGKNGFLLSPSQEKIYDFLKERKSASRKNVQDALNMNPKTLGYHLHKLKEAGFIEQIGNGNEVQYQISVEN